MKPTFLQVAKSGSAGIFYQILYESESVSDDERRLRCERHRVIRELHRTAVCWPSGRLALDLPARYRPARCLDLVFGHAMVTSGKYTE